MLSKKKNIKFKESKLYHHCLLQDSPGPGAYSFQELSKPRHLNSPGFLSSAKRDDKVAQKFFTKNFVSNMRENKSKSRIIICFNT